MQHRFPSEGRWYSNESDQVPSPGVSSDPGGDETGENPVSRGEHRLQRVRLVAPTAGAVVVHVCRSRSGDALRTGARVDRGDSGTSRAGNGRRRTRERLRQGRSLGGWRDHPAVGDTKDLPGTGHGIFRNLWDRDERLRPGPTERQPRGPRSARVRGRDGGSRRRSLRVRRAVPVRRLSQSAPAGRRALGFLFPDLLRLSRRRPDRPGGHPGGARRRGRLGTPRGALSGLRRVDDEAGSVRHPRGCALTVDLAVPRESSDSGRGRGKCRAGRPWQGTRWSPPSAVDQWLPVSISTPSNFTSTSSVYRSPLVSSCRGNDGGSTWTRIVYVPSPGTERFLP